MRLTGGSMAVVIAIAASTLANCSPAPDESAVAAVAEQRSTIVDSVFPIEVEIERFRAAIGDPVAGLTGGAASIDELITEFLGALAGPDTAGLKQLSMSVEEFAYLYYPETRYTRPPYEMSPGLVWFQLGSYGERGLDRAITRYGGETLVNPRHRCSDQPEIQGANRIWRDCLIEFGEPGERTGVALFGPILEREGRFKFLTYSNGL